MRPIILGYFIIQCVRLVIFIDTAIENDIRMSPPLIFTLFCPYIGINEYGSFLHKFDSKNACLYLKSFSYSVSTKNMQRITDVLYNVRSSKGRPLICDGLRNSVVPVFVYIRSICSFQEECQVQFSNKTGGIITVSHQIQHSIMPCNLIVKCRSIQTRTTSVNLKLDVLLER